MEEQQPEQLQSAPPEPSAPPLPPPPIEPPTLPPGIPTGESRSRTPDATSPGDEASAGVLAFPSPDGSLQGQVSQLLASVDELHRALQDERLNCSQLEEQLADRQAALLEVHQELASVRATADEAAAAADGGRAEAAALRGEVEELREQLAAAATAAAASEVAAQELEARSAQLAEARAEAEVARAAAQAAQAEAQAAQAEAEHHRELAARMKAELRDQAAAAEEAAEAEAAEASALAAAEARVGELEAALAGEREEVRWAPAGRAPAAGAQPSLRLVAGRCTGQRAKYQGQALFLTSPPSLPCRCSAWDWLSQSCRASCARRPRWTRWERHGSCTALRSAPERSPLCTLARHMCLHASSTIFFHCRPWSQSCRPWHR